MSLLPRLSVAIAVVALVGATLVVAQPSLTPPAGPIEESGRFGTLIELNQTNTPGNGDALFVITQPGSYVLTGDADAGLLDGILIESSDVTVDLNGYTLRGQADPGVGGSGTIGIAPTRPTAAGDDFTNITIRNGTITGFAIGFVSRNAESTGQNPGIFNFEAVRLERLNITAANFGILLSRAGGQGQVGGVIEGCVVRANDFGIDAENCVVKDCQVSMGSRADFGFATGIDARLCTITGCAVVMEATLSSANNAYRLFASSVNSSTAAGGGAGFLLQNESIANGCVASNPEGAATLQTGSQAFNSNF